MKKMKQDIQFGIAIVVKNQREETKLRVWDAKKKQHCKERNKHRMTHILEFGCEIVIVGPTQIFGLVQIA